MKSLELEIRSYIIICCVTFMIALLGGCGNTVKGIGQDITTMGEKWTKEEPKNESNK